jgi:hypothetical protein
MDHGQRFPVENGSTYRIEYTQLAPSDNRSTKSADGRVATEAARLRRKKPPIAKEKKNGLDTHRPSDESHL